MDIKWGRLRFLLLGFLILIAGCSGGGGGGGGVDGSGLEGTAAVGSPLGNAEIVVKGANGVKKTTTTKSDGKYNIKVDGLEAPYLLKVNDNHGKRLYSLASKEGTNNVNPFTDVVARNWFKSRGRNIDEEFDSGEVIDSPPLAVEISALIEAVNNLLDAAYGEFLENKDGFDFQHVEFNADGTGFDRLLDYARFNIKQGKVTIKLVDPDGGFEAIIILNFDLSNDLSDPDVLPPDAPTSLVAFPVNGSEAVLVWHPATDNVGVAGYRVYRTNDGSNAFPVTTAFPVFSDTNLEAGTEYCYTVEAFDGAGLASPVTDEVCVTPQPVDDTPPDTITNLSATAQSDTEISLTWSPSASDDVIGYDILRGESGAVSEKIATVVPSGYSDFNLTPETEYCYIVQAFDATGLRSAQSSEACATTDSVDNKPNAIPQINTFSASPDPTNLGSPVNFSWDVSDADGDTLTCELDVNNDSVIDYTVNDCANNLSQLHTYVAEGTFDVRLTVSDGNGGSDQQTITGIVVAGNGNIAPQINTFSVSSNPAIPGTPVSFSWDVSDADGDTLTCELDVNNDSISDYTVNDCANNLSQLHTYTVEGTFDARLTVSDGNGGSDQQFINSIVITEPLALDIAVDGAPAVADSRLRYTITVSNTTALPIDGVNASFIVPAQLSFSDTVDVVPDPAGCASAGNGLVCDPTEEVQWSLGTLAAGESRTITVNALVNPTLLDSAVFDLTVTVSASGQSNVQQTKTVTVNNDPFADLALSASTDAVVPGESFTFSVDVGNTSGGALTNVELRASLPAGVVVGDTDGGTDMGNGNVVWSFASVAVGESLHREVTVIADGGLVAGQILHAELALIHDGGLPVDNTAEHVVTVVDTALPLTVDIATSADPVVADDRVLYTLTVSNTSLLPVDGVNVLMRMPAELSFSDTVDVVPDPAGCAGAGNGLVCDPREEVLWTLGTLAAGESRTITVNALVDVLQLDGNVIATPVRVTATALGDTIDLVKTVRVNSDPFADLVLSASTDAVVPGNTFKFNVDVGNTSGGVLNNVALQATLPAGVSISDTNGGTDMGNGNVVWNIANLAVGESLHREVTVVADGGLVAGQILHAELALTHDGGLPVDNTAEHVITVVDTALPLKVDIATSADPVVADDRVLYTLTVSNTSLLPVDGVSILMRTPGELSFSDTVDVVPDPAGCAGAGNGLVCDPREEVLWTLGTIAAGESRTITFNALVDVLQLDGNIIATPVRVTATDLGDTIDLVKTVRVNSDPFADLVLSASTDAVVPGQSFTFNVDVGNTSGVALANVELRATLPAGLSISNTDGGTDLGNGDVVWGVTSLAVGESLHREVTVIADGGLVAGQILHAELVLTRDGGVPIDNTAEHVITIVDTALPINVDIATSADPVVADDRVLYTLTVSNSSLLPVDGVNVLMRMPAELSFSDTVDVVPDPAGCAGAGNGLVCDPREEVLWSLGTLAAGESRTITFNALVDVLQLDGNLIATPVRITATDLGDTIDLVNTVRVNSDPFADMALSASTDAIVPGDVVTFNIDIGNTSGGTLSNLQLLAKLPAGVTISNAGGGTDNGNNEVVWSVASLAAGASLQRQVTVTADGVVAGDIVNIAVELVHDGGVELDNSAEFAVSVTDSVPPLSVSIAATPDPVVSGGTLSYTITVTNTSALPVDAVTVQYRVPAELSFSNTAAVDPAPAGCAGAGNGLVCEPREEVQWSLGTLAAGTAQVITIDATVAGSLNSGTLINAPLQTTATQLIDTINLQHTTVVGN